MSCEKPDILFKRELRKTLHSHFAPLAGRSDGETRALIQQFSNTWFDEQWYLNEYADVKKAKVNARNHFLNFGVFEGRIPGPGLFRLKTGAEIKAALNLAQEPVDLLHDKDLEINKAGASEALYDMPLFVTWSLTGMCNYHCSYCFGQTKLDKSKFQPLAHSLQILKSLERFNRPLYDFTISGGEATIVPHFADLLLAIITKFQGRLNHVDFFTNGSQKLEFFERVNDYASEAPLSVTMSLHTEHLNPDHIYRIVETMQKNAQLNLSLMFNPDKFDLVQELFNTLLAMRKNNFFELGITTLREAPTFTKIDSRYTPQHFVWHKESQALFRKTAAESDARSPLAAKGRYRLFWEIMNRKRATISYEFADITHETAAERQSLFLRGFFNFRHLYCAGGTHLVSVNPDGTADTMRCALGKRIGNLSRSDCEPDPISPIALTSCSLPCCGCASQDIIPKFRHREEGEEFLEIIRKKQERLLR